MGTNTDSLRQQIYKSMDMKDTQELSKIWKANDRDEWSDQTFDVIKEILQNRNAEIPEQLSVIDKEIIASSTIKKDEEQKYQKIGGWLILVGIGMVLNPFRLLLTIGQIIPIFFNGSWSILTTPGTTTYHPMWAPSIIVEFLGNIAFLVFSIVLAVIFFQKRSVVPKVITAFLLLNLAFVVVDFLLANSIPAVASQGNQGPLGEIARSIIVCLIWVPYFQISKRVKGTFVH
jgi:uncharacterized protein DUF2569